MREGVFEVVVGSIRERMKGVMVDDPGNVKAQSSEIIVIVISGKRGKAYIARGLGRIEGHQVGIKGLNNGGKKIRRIADFLKYIDYVPERPVEF